MIYSVFIVQVPITAGANIVLYNEGAETHVMKYVETTQSCIKLHVYSRSQLSLKLLYLLGIQINLKISF